MYAYAGQHHHNRHTESNQISMLRISWLSISFEVSNRLFSISVPDLIFSFFFFHLFLCFCILLFFFVTNIEN